MIPRTPRGPVEAAEINGAASAFPLLVDRVKINAHRSAALRSLAALTLATACLETPADEIDFFPKQTLEVATPGAWPFLSPLVDFNGDGVLDFITGKDLFLGSGDGTFVPKEAFPRAVAVMSTGDMDGDGRVDILALAPWFTLPVGGADGLQQEFQIALTQVGAEGQVSFSVAQAFPAINPAEPPLDTPFLRQITASLGDLDNDGNLDFVAFGNVVTEAQGEPGDATLLVRDAAVPGRAWGRDGQGQRAARALPCRLWRIFGDHPGRLEQRRLRGPRQSCL